ncbi:MAG: ring-opening amidohydrolase [Actinomycetota bacterium]|nr:ring-opening amidohydrolase [Actinomycetota bacterium]
MNKRGMVPIATLHVVQMRTPSDTSEIEKLFASGEVDPYEIIAVVGKTEGSGLPNDHGRAFGDLSIRSLLASYKGTTPNQIAEEITLAISGGSPGTVAPHATILSQRWVPEHEVAAEQPTGGLVLGRSHTTEIYPQDIGRVSQVDATTKAVLEAIEDAGIEDLSQIHMVLVKGPALSAESIATLLAKGIEPVTRDPGIGPMGSMCYSNDAMAIGVGIALGEIEREKVTDATIRNDWSLYSNVAATSSGGEKLKGEVLVIANSPKSHSRLRAGHGITTSVGSSDGLKEALRSAGLNFDCCPTEADKSNIAQIFGKFTLPGSAQLNGARITLLDDHEAHHIAKTIGGATVTSVTGLTMAFISGGEANSHMGPPNGNPICAVVKI